ncbi:a5854a42-19ae-4b31-b26d-11c8e86673ba [Thermothielavioides terrestris]
MTNTY